MSDYKENMLPRLLRIEEVLKVIPVGKSTWWAGVKTGRFPKPIKIGSRMTAWRLVDIEELISNLHKYGPNATNELNVALERE